MTDTLPKDNDWIEWNGGECPVSPDAVINIRTRIPESSPREDAWFEADDVDWDIINEESDIIAYRVVRP